MELTKIIFFYVDLIRVVEESKNEELSLLSDDSVSLLASNVVVRLNSVVVWVDMGLKAQLRHALDKLLNFFPEYKQVISKILVLFILALSS